MRSALRMYLYLRGGLNATSIPVTFQTSWLSLVWLNRNPVISRLDNREPWVLGRDAFEFKLLVLRREWNPFSRDDRNHKVLALGVLARL